MTLSTGCSTVILPLCPAVARYSYGPTEPESPINKIIVNRSLEAGIEIKQLSWFLAEYRGSYFEVNRLVKRYPSMVCAFDPNLRRTLIRETYMSCMEHASDWISISSSDSPWTLMTSSTSFYENCGSPH